MLDILLIIAWAFLAATGPVSADPISAGITAAVTAATTGISAAAVGTFVVNTALSVGAAYLSRALMGKSSSGAGGASNSSVTLQMTISADNDRELVFGRRIVGGSLHYYCKYGPQNENVDLIIVLADHEIDALEGVIVNGTSIAMHMDEAGYQDVPEFHDKWGIPMLSFRLYKGRADQGADTEVVGDSGGQWTTDHRLRGCAYVKVRLVFNPDVWGSSLPTLMWKIRGAKVYDPRKDSTIPGSSGPHRWGQPETYEFSENLEVCRYNYLRGIYVNGDKWFGVGVGNEDIDLPNSITAMNTCDEQVYSILEGGYQARYSVAAVIAASETHREVLKKFSVACAGTLPDLSGQYRMLPGVAQMAVIEFTDGDLADGTDFTGSNHRPFDEVVCEVSGSWADPAANYESSPLPTRYSSADEAQDGGFRRSEPYDLSFAKTQNQGQRCMEIYRRLARRQITHTLTLTREFSHIEAGDWVAWTSAKYGYVQKTFRVEAATLNDDWTIALQLREIDADVYGFNPATDEVDPSRPQDLPSGGPGGDIVTGVGVALATVQSIDGTQFPAIRVTWNPITDPTVYALMIEYRRVGDAPWLTFVATEDMLRAGAATITAGIVGGDFYQARVTPLTSPRRSVVASAIVTTSSVTAEVIVQKAAVSTVTEAVYPGVITQDALDAVFRNTFNDALFTNLDNATLGLMTQAFETTRKDELQQKVTAKLSADVAAGLNPIGAGIERIDQVQSELTAALAQTQTNLNASIAGVAAELQAEETTRATADQALSQTITTNVAQLASNIAYVQSQVDAIVEPGETTARRADELFAQNIANYDATTLQQMIEASQRGDDITALKKALDVSSASISEVRTTTATNGAAIATLSQQLTAETTARQAQVTAEITARADGDTAVANYAQSLVAGETNARVAAVSAETQARQDATGALASQITTVAAVANNASAQGQWGIAATAGADGAAVTYRIYLNAYGITAGLRMDAMSGGTSRVLIDAQSLYLRSNVDGVLTPVFGYSDGYFYLAGNVRITGDVVVSGTLTAANINEYANIGVLTQMQGSYALGGGAVSTGWFDVQGAVGLVVAPRGGWSNPLVFVQGVCGLTSVSANGACQTQVRIVVNGAVVYGPVDIFNRERIPINVGYTDRFFDMVQLLIAGGSMAFQLQMNVSQGGMSGNNYVKISIINQAR